MTFSTASLWDIARGGSCSTSLWITQRFIWTVGWYSSSVMEWKSVQRYKVGSGWCIGFIKMSLAAFAVYGKG